MHVDLNPILSKLVTKSEEGKVSWKPTYDTDTFVAALEGEFIFQVAKMGPQYTFVMKDKEDRNLVEIVSRKREWDERSERDHIIEKGSHSREWNDRSESDIYFEQLEHLYDLARDLALDIPNKLTAAATLLDRV